MLPHADKPARRWDADGRPEQGTRPVIVIGQLLPWSLPLAIPWSSHRGAIQQRRGYLLRLESEEGLVGWGEAAPMPEMGSETFEQSGACLQPWLRSITGRTPEHLLEHLNDQRLPPAARCGAECALLNLIARHRQLPVARLLNPTAVRTVRINGMIGGLIGDYQTRLSQAISDGFRIIKVKLGILDASEEMPILRQIATQLPRGVRLRLDANGAWDFSQADRWVQLLNKLPVEQLEEPLILPDTRGLARLQRQADFPLALDESIGRIDLSELFQARAIQRIVLKPTLLGGSIPTLRIAAEAQRHGLKSVITSCIESNIGLHTVIHTAAALGNMELKHGLDTARWFASNLAPSVPTRRGWMDVPLDPPAPNPESAAQFKDKLAPKPESQTHGLP